MKKYKEKEIKKYVIADLSQTTNYLLSKKNANYCLIDNIAAATKFLNKSIAEDICKECMANYKIELVVIPILITYEILEEE